MKNKNTIKTYQKILTAQDEVIIYTFETRLENLQDNIDKWYRSETGISYAKIMLKLESLTPEAVEVIDASKFEKSKKI